MSRDQAKPTAKGAKAAPASNPALDALAAGKALGSVKFDERGNALWEFSKTEAIAAGRDSSKEPLKRLDNPALSLAEHTVRGRAAVRANPLGTLKGYDPYESGELARPKSKRSKKKDLRKLGEWMKLRRQASKNKQDP